MQYHLKKVSLKRVFAKYERGYMFATKNNKNNKNKNNHNISSISCVYKEKIVKHD